MGRDAPRSAVAERLPELGAREVHVWTLDLGGGQPAAAEHTLSTAELARAARFVFERDRNRYLRSRLAVRRILAGYLGVAPGAVPIVIGEHGKPLLDQRQAPGFGLSHAGDRGLLAVGRARHIGVDLEEIDATRDVLGLALTVFCRAEIDAIERKAAESRVEAFFTCWTRKEACLKTFGTGFSIDPRGIDAGATAERRRLETPWGAERFLEVASIIREPGRAAALAVGGGFDEARLLDWPDFARP